MPPTTNCPSGYSWNGSACVPPTQSCPSNYYWNGSVCTPYQTGGPYYPPVYNYTPPTYYPPTYYYPSYSYQQPINYYLPQQNYVQPANYYYPSTTYVQPQTQVQSQNRYNVSTTQVRYVDGQPSVTYVAQAPVTPTPAPTPVNVGASVETFNVRIVSDANNNTIISWDNNAPTTGEVVFGFTSQPADGLSSYSYDFTTGPLLDLNVHHEANLGQLELNRPYHIRIISRTPEGATDITSEITYIPVPGKAADITVSQPNGSASAFTTLGGLFNSAWFLFTLLLLAIVILIAVILTKRRAE